MRLKPFLIFILFALGGVLFANETEAPQLSDENSENPTETNLEDELLSVKSTSTFDARFDSPAKKFYFYKGSTAITEKEFEAIVDDPALAENRRKLRQTKIAGFATVGILGGLGVCFMIPSLVFIISQANNDTWSKKGYKTWLAFYNSEYTYVFLPGLICIVLTGVFVVSTLFALAFTLYGIHKYSNNETLYQAVIKRYNLKMQQKYQLQPNFDIKVDEENNESLEVSFRMKL
ncbi:MAG: hypothetical protein J1G30_00315 [Spirochaetales bacterium]|nr:hypothetical protein [Spirochaetales bacterium]